MKRAFAVCILAAFAAISIDTVHSGRIASAASPPAKTSDSCASKTSKWQRAQCENYTKSAPGDEYFGNLKLSYLGINNTFRDSTIRAGAYTLDSGLISKINFADDALRSWASKYPGDPQLARSYYLAIGAFAKVYTAPAQDKAWQYMNLLVRHFPSSYFGKIVKKNLQVGFTEHYFALALPCPTPLPTNLPTNAQLPTPEPVSTDTPTPTPTTAPGQPKIQIITQPCVPATPEPTEMPVSEPTMPSASTPIPGPTVTPSPTSSGTPFPTPSTSP